MKFGTIKILTSFIRWIVQIVNFGRRRFLLISPPTLSRQVIYDFEEKEFLSVFISSYFDWATVFQIFAMESYRLRSKSHFAESKKIYASLISKGQTPLILDLGFNIGISGRYFEQVWPKARVIGVEIDSNNVALSIKNCSPQTRIIEAAIGATPGVAQKIDPLRGNNAFTVKPFQSHKRDSAKLKVITVDSILESYPNDKPFLVKIDIEGSEKYLFETKTSWINKFPILVIELHDWIFPGEGTSRSFLSAISKFDRDLLLEGENLWSVMNSKSKK